MDELAALSQQRAEAAQASGRFDREILPIEALQLPAGATPSDAGAPAPQRTKVLVTKDDGIRPGTTKEKLAKIRAAFPQWGNGATTGGNASQITDGVAGVLLMTRRKAEELGLEILGKHVATSVAGLAPRIMGIVSFFLSLTTFCCVLRDGAAASVLVQAGIFPAGVRDKTVSRNTAITRILELTVLSFCTRSRQGPAFAIPKVLERCNISKEDVDLFEVNEAFASMYSYMIDIYGLPLDRTNVNGGAIALGHPLGCSECFSFFLSGRKKKKALSIRSRAQCLAWEQPY